MCRFRFGQVRFGVLFSMVFLVSLLLWLQRLQCFFSLLWIFVWQVKFRVLWLVGFYIVLVKKLGEVLFILICISVDEFEVGNGILFMFGELVVEVQRLRFWLMKLEVCWMIILVFREKLLLILNDRELVRLIVLILVFIVKLWFFQFGFQVLCIFIGMIWFRLKVKWLLIGMIRKLVGSYVLNLVWLLLLVFSLGVFGLFWQLLVMGLFWQLQVLLLYLMLILVQLIVNWVICLLMKVMVVGLLNVVFGLLGNSELFVIVWFQFVVLVVGIMKLLVCVWDVLNNLLMIRVQSNGNGFLVNRQEILFLLFKVLFLVDCQCMGYDGWFV